VSSGQTRDSPSRLPGGSVLLPGSAGPLSAPVVKTQSRVCIAEQYIGDGPVLKEGCCPGNRNQGPRAGQRENTRPGVSAGHKLALSPRTGQPRDQLVGSRQYLSCSTELESRYGCQPQAYHLLSAGPEQKTLKCLGASVSSL
jgi:hypothetical protein